MFGEDLLNRLGISISDEKLLKKALTHSSYSEDNYERLEFLGDSILEFCASEWLYDSFPELDEGELTKLRQRLVCEESLYTYAREHGIEQYIRLGDSEISNNGRGKRSIISDTVESLIAAVYLDKGIKQAKAFVKDICSFLFDLILKGRISNDYKTLFQEIIRSNEPEASIEYVIVDRKGPDHAPVFTSELLLNGEAVSRGTGSSKKESEQNAARAACNIFTKENRNG
ncbi:MAG: ribonuclease III [Clostridia bacterium]|nr:ribonuclease III [Clostridia bacterium]